MRDSWKKIIFVFGFLVLALYIGRSYLQRRKVSVPYQSLELPYQAFLMYGQGNSNEKANETLINLEPNNNNNNNNNSNSDSKDVYEMRRDRITKMCAEHISKYPADQMNPNGVKSHILIDRPQRLAYCAVQKSASTFWKRVYRIVTGQSKATSPFDPSVPALQKFDSIALMRETEDAFMQKSLSFMFVREPYGRLFSGYVDKLFSPNVMFWRNTGAFGISILRRNPSRVDLTCGHDLTFREFVKTVLYSEEHNIKRNGHFTPQYEHCDPCRYRYDVIGTLETLAEDTFYLLDRMGKPSLKKSLENDFRGQSLNDTIRDQVGMLFGFRRGYRECNVPFFDAQKRMWKKFQIRGVISKDFKYPVTRQESETLTKETLTALIFKDVVDKNVAKQNKNDALLEAFSTVDKADMDSLSKLFTPDCELFGYDCRPSKLFDIRSPIEPWYFDINTA